MSVPVRGRLRRPPGQLALGQLGKVAGTAPMAGQLKVYPTREDSSIGIAIPEWLHCGGLLSDIAAGLASWVYPSHILHPGPEFGRCAFWLLHGRTAAQVALRHRDCLPATLNASSKATPPFRRGG